MQHAGPSRTAIRVALRRAAHQLYDARPLVFEDPLAIRILGQHAEELQRTPGRSEAYKPRPHSIALRAFLVGRSRYAEDLLARTVQSGVRQYVILGAGLDTFAYRNPYPDLCVFEVDHPVTQQWKRELLVESGIAVPPNLTYTPVDFRHDSLSAQLITNGFNPAQPTFFSWLGVVPYLTLPAFRATLSYIAAQPPGSGLVFDYSQPRETLSPIEQLAHDSLASRVQLAGEPFELFFTRQQAAQELAAFRNIEDLNSSAINARYFTGRADKLRVLGSAPHIISAWIGQAPSPDHAKSVR